MSVFYKYQKAIKTPFHSLSLPALAAWNAWKAQLLPSGLNHFLIRWLPARLDQLVIPFSGSQPLPAFINS